MLTFTPTRGSGTSKLKKKVSNKALIVTTLITMLLLCIATTTGFFSQLSQSIQRAQDSPLLFSRGELSSRILSICASQTLTSLNSLNLKIVWQSDSQLHSVPFSNLFSNTNFEVTDDLSSSLSINKSYAHWTAQNLYGCTPLPSDFLERKAKNQLEEFIIPLYFPPNTRIVKCPTIEQFIASIQLCLQSFKPVPAVKQLLLGTNWKKVENSVGLWVQAGESSLSPFNFPLGEQQKPESCKESNFNNSVYNYADLDPRWFSWQRQAHLSALRFILHALKKDNTDSPLVLSVGGSPSKGVSRFLSFLHKKQPVISLKYTTQSLKVKKTFQISFFFSDQISNPSPNFHTSQNLSPTGTLPKRP